MSAKHILNSLNTYMFTGDIWNHENSARHLDNTSHKKKHNVSVKNTCKDTFLIPQYTDKLFWCFYILKFGVDKYDSIYNKNFQTEKAFKLKVAEDLKYNENILKTHKLKKHIIENELINENNITIIGLYAMCLIYKINIIYVINRTFYKLISETDNTIHVIKKDEKGNIGIMQTMNQNEITDITKKFYEMINHNKPILAFSAYKLQQLQDIAYKLEIPLINKIGGKKTKKNLYEDILAKF